ncbi:MAG: putative bifunctional diguanylate cyclase/phosphodiesterase [Hasllibacter sp.]
MSRSVSPVVQRIAAAGGKSWAAIPLLCLGAYAGFGVGGLMGAAVALPALALLGGPREGAASAEVDGLTGLGLRESIEGRLDRALIGPRMPGRRTTCLVVELEDFRRVADRVGHRAAEELLHAVGQRIKGACRAEDVVGRLHGTTFAVALQPTRGAGLEGMMQLAGRIQAAVALPIPAGRTTAYLTASIGFCLQDRSPRRSGAAMLEAAEGAAIEARRRGPAAVRSWSAEMHRTLAARDALMGEVEAALDAGAIAAWFQPQIDTDTGRLAGVEALARWIHPERGTIPPAEFLPALEQAGLLENLGETMLEQALDALRRWGDAGLHVPQVGVNFSGDELANPSLPDRVAWTLDRYDIGPGRLAIEVLETVVAGPDDDVVTRNLGKLAEMGCRIDLDDFGTGQASISNIRRFAIGRIKIDRSFVSHLDRDEEQRRMVGAILDMAARLGLETLAEGVETEAEHAVLAQLGCGAVQGFGIGRPMPPEELPAWAARREAALPEIPRIGRAV